MQRDNRLCQHLGGSIIAQFSCFPEELDKCLHEQLHWKWVCCWSTTPPLGGFSEQLISAGKFITNRRLCSDRAGALILLCFSRRLVPFCLHLPFSQQWPLCHQLIYVRSWFWPLWWGQMEIKPLQSIELHQKLNLFTGRRAEHVKCWLSALPNALWKILNAFLKKNAGRCLAKKAPFELEYILHSPGASQL